MQSYLDMKCFLKSKIIHNDIVSLLLNIHLLFNISMIFSFWKENFNTKFVTNP